VKRSVLAGAAAITVARFGSASRTASFTVVPSLFRRQSYLGHHGNEAEQSTCFPPDVLGRQRIDAWNRDEQQYASAGMLTLRADYLDGLLTAATGTSMAAPRIAYKAALVQRAFPTASANMIRALLALSASIPAAAAECLRRVSPEAERLCLGYGMPDVQTRA
jgi:hypothetical protein